MRVMLVNWAPIREGAAKGGGVNGYCQALALELVRLGHEVISLSGGTTFTPAPESRDPGPCHVVRREDWRGVRVYEVVNSPVLAPSIHQFSQPLGEVSAPELEACLAALAGRLRPDLVHVHNLEGFSVGSVEALRSGRAPGSEDPPTVDARVFFSLHNYHTVCPQVNLLRGHRVPCFDFDGGHACARCVEAPDPVAARRRIIAGKNVFAPMLPMMPFWLRFALWQVPGLKRGARAVKAWVRRKRRSAAIGPPPPEAPRPMWVPLTNTIQPEPAASSSRRAPNDYAHRRAAMIAMLNSCDSVLAVSDFVRRKYESYGVDPAVISTVHIGTRINELARRIPRVDPPPFAGPGGTTRPVRVVFLGFNHFAKGLPMFADSLALLVPEVLARIHLSVYALGGDAIEERFRRMERRLAGLTFRNGYRFDEIPRLLAGQDLGVVPSIWWDNGPQTVFEFLACGVPVLGAEVGGIPDFIQDGRNGLLFRSNDRYDLARRLAEVVRNPLMLQELRRGVRPPKDIADHALELVRLYHASVSSAPAKALADEEPAAVLVRVPEHQPMVRDAGGVS